MSNAVNPGMLIQPFIEGRLTPEQKRRARRVVEQCRAAGAGIEETALAVLYHIYAHRELPQDSTRRQADSAKGPWLFALAKMVRSPLCEQDEPLTRTTAAKRARKALKDVCQEGSTKEKGFEHLKRPWYAHPAAAAACRDKSRRIGHLPSWTTIKDELKKFVRTLNRAEGAFKD